VAVSEAEEQASAESPAPPAERLSRDERRARMLIIAGTLLLLIGIALALTDDDLSRWLIVGGIVTLFVALHRFGRLGAGGAPA
jgi:hypothetical protein